MRTEVKTDEEIGDTANLEVGRSGSLEHDEEDPGCIEEFWGASPSIKTPLLGLAAVAFISGMTLMLCLIFDRETCFEYGLNQTESHSTDVEVVCNSSDSAQYHHRSVSHRLATADASVALIELTVVLLLGGVLLQCCTPAVEERSVNHGLFAYSEYHALNVAGIVPIDAEEVLASVSLEAN